MDKILACLEKKGGRWRKLWGILKKDRCTQTHILRLLPMNSRHSVVSEGKRRHLLASQEVLLWSTQKQQWLMGLLIIVGAGFFQLFLAGLVGAAEKGCWAVKGWDG